MPRQHNLVFWENILADIDVFAFELLRKSFRNANLYALGVAVVYMLWWGSLLTSLNFCVFMEHQLGVVNCA